MRGSMQEKPSPRSFPRPQARDMERAPGSHHLSRGPTQSAGDRICHPEDRCNTGRKPHVEPFAVLSLSLFGDLTQIALCASASFTLILHVRSRQKCVALLRPSLKRRYVDLVIPLCGLISERRFPYWLAQTMRAIKSTSRVWSVHSTCAGRCSAADRICRAPLDLLHHHRARRGLE